MLTYNKISRRLDKEVTPFKHYAKTDVLKKYIEKKGKVIIIN